MTKRYLKQLDNLDQVINFEDLSDYLQDDDNGQYFVDSEEFDWWQDLANAMQYLEDEEVEYNQEDLNELEDYITLAKNNGFNK